MYVIYKPSTSQLCHFNSEDGGSMFLRNVAIDLPNYTAPKPKILVISTLSK
jgi:hypothetical protein